MAIPSTAWTMGYPLLSRSCIWAWCESRWILASHNRSPPLRWPGRRTTHLEMESLLLPQPFFLYHNELLNINFVRVFSHRLGRTTPWYPSRQRPYSSSPSSTLPTQSLQDFKHADVSMQNAHVEAANPSLSSPTKTHSACSAWSKPSKPVVRIECHSMSRAWSTNRVRTCTRFKLSCWATIWPWRGIRRMWRRYSWNKRRISTSGPRDWSVFDRYWGWGWQRRRVRRGDIQGHSCGRSSRGSRFPIWIWRRGIFRRWWGRLKLKATDGRKSWIFSRCFRIWHMILLQNFYMAIPLTRRGLRNRLTRHKLLRKKSIQTSSLVIISRPASRGYTKGWFSASWDGSSAPPSLPAIAKQSTTTSTASSKQNCAKALRMRKLTQQQWMANSSSSMNSPNIHTTRLNSETKPSTSSAPAGTLPPPSWAGSSTSLPATPASSASYVPQYWKTLAPVLISDNWIIAAICKTASTRLFALQQLYRC